jgi:hypothetical protein
MSENEKKMIKYVCVYTYTCIYIYIVRLDMFRIVPELTVRGYS